MKKKYTLTAINLALVAAWVTASHALAAPITYVDATTGNTTFGDGTPFAPVGEAVDNDLWGTRTFGNSGQIYTSVATENSAQLRTTITDLAAGTTYQVYLYYWVAGNGAPSGNQQWDIAGGLSAGAMTGYAWNAGNLSVAGDFFSAPLISESDRRLFQIDLGSTVADGAGHIEVYVDDYPGNDDRTWYDGVGYAITAVFVDSDNDGMDDAWENDNGLIIGTNDSALDPDGDNLTNLEEYQLQTDPQVADPEELVNDGVWTWFNDERAIWHNGKIYIGYVKKNGRSTVTRYDPATRIGTEAELSSRIDVDDHNNVALHVLPDGRILASYSRHSKDTFYCYRISTNPDPQSIADWGAEQTHGSGVAHSYANTYSMSTEGDKIYTFTRGTGWNPNWTVSTDAGLTWSTLQELVSNGSSSTRPYVRYTGNGVDAVDFIYTDGHPRDEDNSVYHARIKDGNVLRTDGTVIKALSATPLMHMAAIPERGSVVYQYNAGAQADPNEWIPAGRAWIWDVQYQKNDDPVIAFTVQKDNVTGSGWNHDRIYYYYARWTGTEWQKRFIAQAGRPLYSAEDDYAGGICIDPERPNVVYVSSNAADPFDLSTTTNVPLDPDSRYEIWKGTTYDDGLTFSWEALTKDSTEDNLRPFVPRNHGHSSSLLWLKGTYSTYTSYNTSIVGQLGNVQTNFTDWKVLKGYTGGPEDDDNSDGEANLAEYHRYASGLADGIPLVSARLDGADLPPPPASSSMVSELLGSEDLASWKVIAISLYGSPFMLQIPGYVLEETDGQMTAVPTVDSLTGFYRLRMILAD